MPGLNPHPILSLIDPLVRAFVRQETERLDQDLVHIIIKNHSKGGAKEGYSLNGTRISILGMNFTRGITFHPVHPEVLVEAKQNFDLRNMLVNDTRRMRSGLAVLLSRCQSLNGMRNSLPEPLVALLPPDVRDMPRLEHAGFSLKEEPALYAQFQILVDIVGYYQANRLLY